MENLSKLISSLRKLFNLASGMLREVKKNSIIDLSHHNGRVDFVKVKESGVIGLIQRLGYGDSDIDKTADYNINQAYRQALKVGSYWFIYAYSVEDAIKEADFCHEHLIKYQDKLTLPIFADYEYDSEYYAEKQGVKIDKKLRTDIVLAFIKRLESFGWKVGIYANRDYLLYKLDYKKFKKYPLWYADWRNHPDESFVNNSFLWQYTSQGQVSGIEGNVDISVMN